MLLEYGNLFFIYLIGIISVLLFSFATYLLSNKYSIILNKNHTTLILIFSFFFYFISALNLSILKINALNYYLDFATHLEILWRNSQELGLTSLMSEKFFGSKYWFSAHFTPIVYLTYAPIFKVLPTPYIIPISQTLFLCSSLIPLWLISKKYFDKNLSRLLISSFFFYPTIFYINIYGIAYIELCIPLLLWLFYFFEEKKNIFFILTLFLSLLIREEVSLVTSFIGIYILIKKRYLLGMATLLLSLIYFYLVMSIIIPYFNGGNTHIATSIYEGLGNTYIEIINKIFFNPIEVINKIMIVPKIGNFVMILVPLLFTPLLSMPIFLVSAPNLVLTFLSDSITHSSFILYYLSPSIPIFFYAMISGINNLKKFKLLNMNALIQAILIGSVSTTIFFGATPISIAFWNKNYSVGNFYTTNFYQSAYKEEKKDKAAKKIAQLIPDNAMVLAEQHLLPLLYKKRMYVFPDIHENIEYVFIDRFNKKKTGGLDGTYMKFRKNPEFYYNQYFKNSDWMVVNEELGVTLFKRNN